MNKKNKEKSNTVKFSFRCVYLQGYKKCIIYCFRYVQRKLVNFTLADVGVACKHPPPKKNQKNCQSFKTLLVKITGITFLSVLEKKYLWS